MCGCSASVEKKDKRDVCHYVHIYIVCNLVGLRLRLREFGRRKRNPQVNVGTQVEIPLIAPTNQDTINREPTSRASSSLTNTTAVNNINAGWGYGGYSA